MPSLPGQQSDGKTGPLGLHKESGRSHQTLLRQAFMLIKHKTTCIFIAKDKAFQFICLQGIYIICEGVKFKGTVVAV